MIRPGGILSLLLLFLALWPAAGIAQTGSVRGSVVDQTGLVLPGATVILRGEDIPRTAYADEQGTFELAGCQRSFKFPPPAVIENSPTPG